MTRRDLKAANRMYGSGMKSRHCTRSVWVNDMSDWLLPSVARGALKSYRCAIITVLSPAGQTDIPRLRPVSEISPLCCRFAAGAAKRHTRLNARLLSARDRPKILTRLAPQGCGRVSSTPKVPTCDRRSAWQD